MCRLSIMAIVPESVDLFGNSQEKSANNKTIPGMGLTQENLLFTPRLYWRFKCLIKEPPPSETQAWRKHAEGFRNIGGISQILLPFFRSIHSSISRIFSTFKFLLPLSVRMGESFTVCMRWIRSGIRIQTEICRALESAWSEIILTGRLICG